MSRKPLAALALLLAAAPAAAGAAVALLGADGGGGAAGVTVTQLGNAGVLIAGRGRRVVVDALFGDGLPGYATVPPALRAELEAARGEFAGIDLVLATHAHRDHFDAIAVARHLAANRGAVFLSTPEAVAAVHAAPGGAEAADRLRATLPAVGSSETIVHDGIRVTAYQLHHGHGLARPVANLGFLVEVRGRSIVHLGDTEATFDELAATGLASRGVDLALVPFWRLVDATGRDGIRRALRASKIAAIHVPRPDAPATMFGAAGGRAGLGAALGQPSSGVVTLDEAGRSLSLGSARGGS